MALCILSAVPLIVAGAFGAKESVLMYMTACLFPIVAAGVYLFVRFGSIRGSYAKLLQEEEYTVENKRSAKKSNVFAGIYWCLVTALYLGVSFWTMEWHKTWQIWPVGGVLFAALEQIVRAVANKKK